MQIMTGRYPAVVTEYLPDTRQARVSIPGVTDGGKVMPMAEIEYPVGSRSKGEHATEIEILTNDTVWIEFIGGDSRYPLITGFRNPNAGVDTQWRRIHQANIELTADNALKIIASDGKTSVTMSGNNISVEAEGNVNVSATGNAVIEAATITLNDGALGGCVGLNTPCQFTGGAHIGASTKVLVGS